MALVVNFFENSFEVYAGDCEMKMGQILSVDDNNKIVVYSGKGEIIGIAGDNRYCFARATETKRTGWSNLLGDPISKQDYDDERVTVFYGGGSFATDQFEKDVLKSNVDCLLYASSNGRLQSTERGRPIAILTKEAKPFLSGIPGEGPEKYLTGDNGCMYIQFMLFGK